MGGIGPTLIGTATSFLAGIGKAIIEDIMDGGSSLETTSQRSADTIANREAYDREKATKEETQRMYESLQSIKEDFKIDLDNIENKSINYAKDIMNNFIKQIENEFLNNIDIYKDLNINIEDIEYKFSQSIREFKNTFSSEILNHIAIGDARCDEIFKLENKDKRRDKIKNYFDELVGNALDNLQNSINDIVESSLNSMHRNVNRVIKNKEESIKNIKKEIEANMQLSESEIEEKRKEYDKKEEIINSLLDILKIK